MQVDERQRRWSNVIRFGPVHMAEEMMDFLQLLPKERQILAMAVRSEAGQTGFCSFPFREDAFGRFEEYCLTKVGRVRGQYVPEETPIGYPAPQALRLSGFGVEHLPGLVFALREIARGTCRCPAPAPHEVDIVHVRSTLGGPATWDGHPKVPSPALRRRGDVASSPGLDATKCPGAARPPRPGAFS